VGLRDVLFIILICEVVIYFIYFVLWVWLLVGVGRLSVAVFDVRVLFVMWCYLLYLI